MTHLLVNYASFDLSGHARLMFKNISLVLPSNGCAPFWVVAGQMVLCHKTVSNILLAVRLRTYMIGIHEQV